VSDVKRIIKNDMAEDIMKAIQSVGKAMRERDADELKIKKD